MFSFNSNQAKNYLKDSSVKAKVLGLKLLQINIDNNNNNLEPNSKLLGKLLIIIPGRTGKAHDRNKIRRQIKEIFYKEKLYINPKVSILIVYSQALKLNYQELKEFLTKNI